MRAAKGIWVIASVTAIGTAALAGPQSLLDPYANVQAPSAVSLAPARVPKPPKQHKSKDKAVAEMQDNSVGSSVRGGKAREVGEGLAKTTKSATSGLVSGTKAASSGLVSGTKAASSKLVEGSKFVGSGVVTGSKKVGDELVTGATHSADWVKTGAKAMGHGLVAAGGGIKKTTVTAGQKVVELPQTIKQGLKSNGRNTGGSVGHRVAGVPKSMEHGLVASVGAVKNGTKEVGKKVVALPSAMSHGFGKLFHHDGYGYNGAKTASAPAALAE